MSVNSIRKNYIYNLIYQIIIVVVPLITTPYISRIFGPDRIGDVSYVESIVTYFVMLGTPGIAILGQREISYSQDDISRRTRAFWNIKMLEIITSSIALISYILFSLFQNNVRLFLVMGFNILATLVDVTWFFQGMEEFGKIVRRNILIKVISVIFIFVVVRTEDDFLKYGFGLTFFSFVANLSLWRYIPKYVKKIDVVDISPFKYLHAALMLFLPTIATTVYTVLDKTMIGVITRDSAQNGYYEFAMRISKLVLSIVTAIGVVMIPRIGFLFSKGDKVNLEKMMYMSYRLVLLIGLPICAGLIFTSSNFVPWFFGDGYEDVALLLKILAFLVIAIGLSTVTGTQYMVPTKKQNLLTISVCIGAVTNLLLNILLIPLYKAMGAAIASVISEFFITTIQFFMVKREISISKVFKDSVNYIIATVMMSIVLSFENILLLSSLLNTFFMVITGIIIYCGIVIIRKDSFALYIIDNAKAMILK